MDVSGHFEGSGQTGTPHFITEYEICWGLELVWKLRTRYKSFTSTGNKMYTSP